MSDTVVHVQIPQLESHGAAKKSLMYLCYDEANVARCSCEAMLEGQYLHAAIDGWLIVVILTMLKFKDISSLICRRTWLGVLYVYCIVALRR